MRKPPGSWLRSQEHNARQPCPTGNGMRGRQIVPGDNRSAASMRQLLIITVLAILYGSFYPWHFAYIPGQPFLLPVSLSDKRDLILNFWLYAPVGALAFWVFARAGILRWIVPFCLGLALSTFVEVVQPFIPGRVSSQGDILANGFGTLAGMFLAAWAGSAPEFS